MRLAPGADAALDDSGEDGVDAGVEAPAVVAAGVLATDPLLLGSKVMSGRGRAPSGSLETPAVGRDIAGAAGFSRSTRACLAVFFAGCSFISSAGVVATEAGVAVGVAVPEWISAGEELLKKSVKRATLGTPPAHPATKAGNEIAPRISQMIG